MNKEQIAKKHSKVLINTVDVKDILKILEEMSIFSKLLDASKKLKILFTSQIFSEEEKNTAINELLLYLKFSGEGKKFLVQIVKHNHVAAIKEIIRASTAVYNEKLKKTKAVVISPMSLESNYIERLREALKRLTQRDVEIEPQLDPSLIGGFIVKVGSTIYDSSLKGQLRLLRTQL